MNVDLQANPKQYDFYIQAMAAAQGATEKRNLLYGGAIRGGKSFICASKPAALLFLIYKKSTYSSKSIF